MQRLLSFFSDGIESRPAGRIGMEVETSFIDEAGQPISLARSQQLFQALLATERWEIAQRKGEFIAELRGRDGDVVRYELGRQNIEVSTIPQSANRIVTHTWLLLAELYQAALAVQSYPYFGPILRADGDLLAVPDERDVTWLKLDGRQALNALANTTSVHFVLDTTPDKAIAAINRLNEHLARFLTDFPQDANWRYYIANSLANYEPTRYGGPGAFASLHDYCCQLASHRVVTPAGLIPFAAAQPDINLFLRSLWWHFRLRRYGRTLCIEARPNGRYDDACFPVQLNRILASI